MSGQTRLIDEKIKLSSKRSNYYTNNNYNYFYNDKVEELNKVTETIPAGIAGEPASAICDKTTSISVNKLLSVEDKLKESDEESDEEVINTKTEQLNSIYPSYVRFHSLIPDDQKVTVVLGDNYVFKNIKGYSPTKYVALDPGIYVIQFYDSNSNDLLYEYKFKAFNCAINTLIITKTNNMYNIIGLRGTTTDRINNSSYVRFIQTIPNAPDMDIYIDGIAVIWGISSDETSELISLPSGLHNIKITAAATSLTYADERFNFSKESVNDIFTATDNNSLIKLSQLANENACL
ncbi:MAG: DUF4397 domain-containing protein [Candidatus Metalachnospira sp.]|nr:DUF4397 domain-containing protein [Candidatus Metalachnospira sp.]